MYRKNLKSISQVYDEVAALFKSHTDLLEEFTYFLPDVDNPAARKKTGLTKGFRGKGGQQGTLKKKVKGEQNENSFDAPFGSGIDRYNTAASLAKELAFFEKVKTRLRSRESYGELIKCLNIFNSEVISKMELEALVWDILGSYPDLHSGFNDFLTRCESTDFDLSESVRGKDGKLGNSKDTQKISAREKFLLRPISELDLSACERCGPSYRLLPKNFPKASASARSPLCQEHLNDNWVSVTSGSEDYSFKAMRKNQYEEALFRCEDDRFELDMVLETTEVTVDALQAIFEKINRMTAEEASHYRIPEGFLTPIHLRTIERVYGIGTDHGQDIRRMILDYPVVTIPMVLSRLKQKDLEWRKVKEEVTPIWVDVYEKNYNKSLDHRSFYFKQTDKKALSVKGMTNEIKEVSDKRKNSDDHGNIRELRGHALSPDLTFHYADRKVHDDIYAVLKFSTNEMMSTEHADRIMKMWRDFIEPFFGINRVDGEYFDDSAEQASIFVSKFNGEDVECSEENDQAEEENPENVTNHTGLNEILSNFPDVDADVKPGDPQFVVFAKEAEFQILSDDRTGERDLSDRTLSKDMPVAQDISEAGDGFEMSNDGEERIYAACKPLACSAQVTSAESVGSDTYVDSFAKLSDRLFYGHDGYYMLFRLHQHLYDRLSTARASAVSMSTHFGQKVGPEEERAAKEREIHDDFLRLLFKLLNGTADASNFEDDCRTLLGANSYVLFTLDKLVYKIVKQVQNLFTDEMASKLLDLSEYESARSTPFIEAIYHANASVLLLDEACFRIGSSKDGEVLTIKLMEFGLEKAEVPAGTMEAHFHEYLEDFLQTIVVAGEGNTTNRLRLDRTEQPDIFLARSKVAAGHDLDGHTSHGPAKERPYRVSVFNSLECKIACNNSKVSYVLDTEDIFHRKRLDRVGKFICTKVKHATLAKSELSRRKFRMWLARKESLLPRAKSALGTTNLDVSDRVLDCSKRTPTERAVQATTAGAAADLKEAETVSAFETIQEEILGDREGGEDKLPRGVQHANETNYDESPKDAFIDSKDSLAKM
mgnify:CR=1 FL=1